MLKKAILASVALVLVSCDSFGPVTLTMKIMQDFSLNSGRTGDNVQFKSGDQVAIQVDGGSRKITLKFQGQKIEFRKPRYEKDTGIVFVNPSESEVKFGSEGVGLRGLGKLINQERQVWQERRTCTAYRRECRNICQPLPNGGRNCYQQCTDYPYTGWETVEYEDITNTWEYNANIMAEKSGLLAAGRGTAVERFRTSREIFRCM
jgi:hypothetical protein